MVYIDDNIVLKVDWWILIYGLLKIYNDFKFLLRFIYD